MGVLQNRVSQTAINLLLARLVKMLQFPPYQGDLDHAIHDDTGVMVTSVVGGGNVNCPPFYYGKSAGLSVLLVSCTQGLAMAGQLVDGYGAINIIRPPIGVNSFYASAANIIRQAMSQARVALIPTSRLIMAGHSAGGAIVQALAVMRQQERNSVEDESVSFGAPRVGTPSFTLQLDRQTNVRWMDTEDPVPLIPPRSSDGAGWPVILGQRLAGIYHNFQHAPGGLVLTNEGTCVAAELPTVARIAPTTSIAAWLQSQVYGTASAHKIDRYILKLEILLRNVQRRTPAIPTPAVAERAGQIISRAAQNREEGRVVGLVFNTGQVQNQAAPTQPRQRLFTAARNGRMWYVYFGDEAVAIGPGRRRARALAASANDFLRRLQRQAYVDPNNLMQQMGSYIEAASVPENGFIPPLQTQLPG